jgi:hypothetical protein
MVWEGADKGNWYARRARGSEFAGKLVDDICAVTGVGVCNFLDGGWCVQLSPSSPSFMREVRRSVSSFP